MIVEKVNTKTSEVVTIYESPEIKFTAKTLELPGTTITLNGDLYEFREGKPVENRPTSSTPPNNGGRIWTI